MRTHGKISLFGLVTFAIISLQAHALPNPWDALQLSPGGQLQYQKVNELPGQCQDKLFEKACLWFAQAKECRLVLKDKKEGSLSGNGSSTFSCRSGISNSRRTLYYSVLIEVKENKLRYTFSNLMIRDEGSAVYRSLEDYKQQDSRKASNIAEAVTQLLEETGQSIESAFTQQIVAEQW
jgi:hypothetical protein